MKEQIIHAIVDKEDRIVYNTMVIGKYMAEHDAWCKFFEKNAHKTPIGNAIKAYKAIGYKCAKFKLVRIEDETQE